MSGSIIYFLYLQIMDCLLPLVIFIQIWNVCFCFSPTNFFKHVLMKASSSSSSSTSRENTSDEPYTLGWVRRGSRMAPLQFSGGGEAGRRILSKVTEHGLNETKFLKEIKEPELFKQGLVT